MGYDTEAPYYDEAVQGCLEAGIAIAIGERLPR